MHSNHQGKRPSAWSLTCSEGHTYYRCHTRTLSEKTIREEEVEKVLLEKLSRIWFPEREETYFRKRYEEFLENIGTVQQQQVNSLRLRLDQISAQLSRLADGYSEGILAPEVVKEKQNALLAEKKDIEGRLQKVQAGEKRIIAERMEKFFERAKSAAESYKSGLPEEKRVLVKSMTSNLKVRQKNVSIMLDLPFSELQDILFGILFVLLLAGFIAFEYWCLTFRIPDPLAMVIGDRFYPSDDPRLGHPLGTYAALIFDRPGKVFLADGDDIVPLDKRELQKRLTVDELGAVRKYWHSAKKICVVRNHELMRNMSEWLARRRYYWPGAGGWTSGSGKNDIIVSPL